MATGDAKSLAAGSVPLSQEDERAFLQARLALFGKMLFFLSFGLHVALGLLHAALPAHQLGAGSFAPWSPFNLAFCGIFLAVWLVCRTGQRSYDLLSFIDVAGILIPCFGYVYVGLSADPSADIQFVLLLGVTNTMPARAVIVPSTVRRTVWIGVALSVFVVVGTWVYQPAGPDAAIVLSGRALLVGAVAVWSAIAVSIAAVISKVIYGLHEQVREASQLGQYTLEEVIGEGGMGVVYRAHHAMLRRPTAVKLLTPDKAGKRCVERFEREVQLTARLTHPNTVTVFDYGRTPEGTFYYAMELLEGATLQTVVELTGPLPPARASYILRQVAGALEEAHGVNLIHRDIKPANVMLCERGGMPDMAKVLDFGLVKVVESDRGAALTGVNEVTGTPQYMSPEAIETPSRVDARADIYSLGALAYYLLTGEHVFPGTSALDVCHDHVHTAPVPPSKRVDAEIPPAFEALILDCLAKDPADRPSTAADFEERLLSCPGVGVWDRARANLWWRDHDELRRRHPHSPGAVSVRTLPIDLKGRLESSSRLSLGPAAPPSQPPAERTDPNRSTERPIARASDGPIGIRVAVSDGPPGGE